jgi:hypothetical protein
MSNNSPIVKINTEGICNYCHLEHIPKTEDENTLLKMINQNRSSSSKFDCLVNISGGRDSTFTILKLVKDYSLKVLAVNYKNPFTDKIAKQNIDNIIKKLNVEFVQFSFKNYLHEKILRNNILAWFKNPSASMVPVICIGCKIIWPTILKIAKNNKIKLIVNGGNPYEYTSFKKELLGVNSNSSLEKTYFSNIAGLIYESIKNLRYLKLRYLPTTLKAFLFSNQYAIGSRIFSHNIKRIDLFHYIEWDENMVLSRIQKELDWKYPKELEGTWRFDCKISHLKDYMYLKTIGMTEKDDFYSKLIRAGKITRDDALERIKKENKIQYGIIKELFAQVGIDENNIELKM